MEDPVYAFVFYVVFVMSATFHEAAHAWAAKKGGDLTAYWGGQVSLDPRPHIRREPFGMVVLPVIMLFVSGFPFGFASAPYNPHWERQFPKRAAWMALAGPGANLVLVIAAALLMRVGIMTDFLYAPERIEFTGVVGSDAERFGEAAAFLLSATFSLNLILFAFNLLPVPPLDGSSGILLFMSKGVSDRYLDFMRQPGLSLIGFLVAYQLAPHVFDPVFSVAIALLYPEISYS